MDSARGRNGENRAKFRVFPDQRFVDLSLYQFGWERCEPLHSYGPFVRNHYLFHYVIRGKGTLTAADSSGQNRSYTLCPGQGFLICPRQITTYCADMDDPWEYTWLEFDGLRAKEALEFAGLDVGHPVFHSRSPAEGDKLRDILLYITDHSEASTLQLTGQGFLFLDQLGVASANRHEKQGKRLRDFYLKEAIDFIEQNYQSDISVEDIAGACSLNRSYFGKLFRNAVGQSPQEFLISYRMNKASQLLRATKKSIGEISVLVGYANQLHFSRAFKGVCGCSPKEWRNRHSSG